MNSKDYLENFSLEQNFPNPFNPETVITYHIPSVQHVELKVFDMIGREIATLVDKEQSPGSYEVTFDAGTCSNTKDYLSSAIFLYRIKAGEFIKTNKMILIK